MTPAPMTSAAPTIDPMTIPAMAPPERSLSVLVIDHVLPSLTGDEVTTVGAEVGIPVGARVGTPKSVQPQVPPLVGFVVRAHVSVASTKQAQIAPNMAVAAVHGSTDPPPLLVHEVWPVAVIPPAILTVVGKAAGWAVTAGTLNLGFPAGQAVLAPALAV